MYRDHHVESSGKTASLKLGSPGSGDFFAHHGNATYS